MRDDTKRKQANTGITLIALIITVIIMLILAGVAINLTIGDNGIFKKSEEGAQIYQNSANNEAVSLNNAEQEMGNLINKYHGGNTETGKKVEDVKGKDKFENTTTITDKNKDKVTIPGGFRVTEDSADEVNKGIIIADGNGNEFVWVPVPDPTTMYEEETVRLSGVEVTTNRYSRLRGVTTAKPGSTGYREPDVLIDTTNGDFNSIATDRGVNQIKNVLGIAGGTNEEILRNYAISLAEEYNAMIESVIKYKGFYIGRYEITGTVDNPTSKRGASITNQNWYNLKKACSNVVNSQYVKSAMIYGDQWDETMSWIVSSGAKTEEEVNSDSRSWGNYKDSIGEAITNSGSKQDTGSNEAWKANNIYDVAGNCSEWTQEAYNTSDRIGRGR